MTSVWDDPTLQITDSFFSWKDKPAGTNITGVVQSIGIHTWSDGKACPQFILDVDGEEIGLTVSQIGLKRIMAEQRPEVGDTISVTLTSIEPRPGGKTLKHYDMVTTRKGAAPVAPAPAPAAPAPAPAAPPAAVPPQVDLTDPNVVAALAQLAAQQK